MKQRNILAAGFALMLVALSLISCKKNPEQPLIDALDQTFSSAFPQDGPGAAVLITRGGKVLLDKGYGLADMDTKAKIDGDTFFNIASMSKQFTAVAILQLAQEGKLSVDDCIHKYFPEFKADFWDRITIANLMSHTSGVPDARGYIPYEEKILATDSLSMAYLYNLDTLNFQPGEQYEYINPTYVVLGRIVERVSGEEFEAYMRSHIFDPAQMKSTVYYVPDLDARIPNMSHGYELGDQDSLWHECDYGEETFFATRPDGGIYTSTHEFLSWEKALHNGTVLDKEYLELAQTPKILVSENPVRQYGYGWIVEHRDNAPVNVYHTGANGGFRTLGAYYPASDVEVIIFSNRVDFNWAVFKPVVEELMGI